MISKVFNWKAKPKYIKGFTGQKKKVKFSKIEEADKEEIDRLQEILDKRGNGEDNSQLIHYLANTPHPANNPNINPMGQVYHPNGYDSQTR